MPGDAHATLIHPGDRQQHAHGPLGVIQAFAHQRVAIQQPVAHGAVVLQPVVVVRLHAANRGTPILEAEGVRRQHHEAPAGQRRPEGLEGIAHQAGHLALAEVELPVVLVENDNAAERVAPLGREQEGRDDVAFESQVFDTFPVESIACHDLAALEGHRNRLCESQEVSKRFGGVGHQRQW
jgi:hypothetical protein